MVGDRRQSVHSSMASRMSWKAASQRASRLSSAESQRSIRSSSAASQLHSHAVGPRRAGSASRSLRRWPRPSGRRWPGHPPRQHGRRCLAATPRRARASASSASIPATALSQRSSSESTAVRHSAITSSIDVAHASETSSMTARRPSQPSSAVRRASLSAAALRWLQVPSAQSPFGCTSEGEDDECGAEEGSAEHGGPPVGWVSVPTTEVPLDTQGIRSRRGQMSQRPAHWAFARCVHLRSGGRMRPGKVWVSLRRAGRPPSVHPLTFWSHHAAASSPPDGFCTLLRLRPGRARAVGEASVGNPRDGGGGGCV